MVKTELITQSAENRRIYLLNKAYRQEYERILADLQAHFNKQTVAIKGSIVLLEVGFREGNREPLVAWARQVVPGAFRSLPGGASDIEIDWL